MLIEGDRISGIGNNLEGDDVIDGSHGILLPGLINTHTHVAMTHLRGHLDDISLSEFLERTFKLDAERSEDGIYNSSVIGMLEMIDSGVTSFLDLYYSEDIIERAVKATGIRGFLSWVTLDQEYTTQKGNPLDNARSFVSSEPATGLSSRSVGVQGVYVAGDETYVGAKEIADRHKTILHSHLSETREEVYNHVRKTGKRPVEFLDSIGVLGDRFIAAHAAFVTLNEVRILSRNKTKVSWNPISNAKLATGGICPVPEMLEEGVTVAVGTDSSGSNNSLSLLESMKFGGITVNNSRWDPTVMTAQKILDAGTIGGAEALGRSDLGRIEVGKTADLILIDTRHPGLMNIDETNAVSGLVYSANSSNVDSVIINGRILKRNHKLLSRFDDLKRGDFLR